MRCAVSIFPQNFTDWNRFEADERHDAVSHAPAISDGSIFADDVRLARQVEALGFDGLWTVEHHFTPYAMVTNPLQFLTYFAGCTSSIDLGTMVIVLPWHQPVRVAESIVMLEQFLGDRRLVLGLGRGAGRREFEGFEIPMGESRSRFLESLEIIRRALSGERFSFDGEHYTIPEIELRPRPRDPQRLLDNLRMAWGSPGSIPVAAEAGLKPMIVPQKPWNEYVPELATYNRLSREAGFQPAGPIACIWIFCAETDAKAREGAGRYIAEYSKSSTLHYEMTGSHFAGVKGYEFYAQRAAELNAAAKNRDELLALRGEARLANNVFGTPDQCVEKISSIVEATGAEELVLVIKYSSMSYEVAEASLKLFAKEALPHIKALRPGNLVSESAA
jgi:alkanesulfonate monooxygenase SsuD/methylene tetrahydromethanopterin reductase-like flavin-dependent oxidoreductase (luciferase family)